MYTGNTNFKDIKQLIYFQKYFLYWIKLWRRSINHLIL